MERFHLTEKCGMRKAEYILQYRIDQELPDYREIVEVTCQTELSNLAHAELRTSRVDNVNFNFLE